MTSQWKGKLTCMMDPVIGGTSTTEHTSSHIIVLVSAKLSPNVMKQHGQL